jgi:hypothetical protein
MTRLATNVSSTSLPRTSKVSNEPNRFRRKRRPGRSGASVSLFSDRFWHLGHSCYCKPALSSSPGFFSPEQSGATQTALLDMEPQSILSNRRLFGTAVGLRTRKCEEWRRAEDSKMNQMAPLLAEPLVASSQETARCGFARESSFTDYP